MGRAEKYALIQSQALMWALVAAFTYFLATKVSVALAIVYAATMLAVACWIAYRLRRHARRRTGDDDSVSPG